MTLPVSIEDARTQLRAEPGERDDEITSFILDAAAWVEQYTGHILEARDVVERFRAPARSIELRAWPINHDAAPVISYTGPNGPGTVDLVRLDLSRRPARVLPGLGLCWPVFDPAQSLTVTIRAGYENPADVPRNFRRAMLVLIGAYDEDREGGAVLAAAEVAATRLCRGFKVHRL